MIDSRKRAWWRGGKMPEHPVCGAVVHKCIGG
jgi:hypothetical protein